MLAHMPLLKVSLLVNNVDLVAVLAVLLPLGGVSPQADAGGAFSVF